jgi:hypothetical protein
MRFPHNPGVGMDDPVIRNLGSSLLPASSCGRHLAFASKPPDGAALGAVDQLCTFRLTDGKEAS